MDSPPPRFSDTSARFTEHLDSSPGYSPHHTLSPVSPTSPTSPTSPAAPTSPRYDSHHDMPPTLVRSSLQKQRPFPPEVYESGLEVVQFDEADKEVAYPSAQTPPPSHKFDFDPPEPRRRICGVSAVLFAIVVVALVIAALAIGLGVGLGIGLTHHKKASTTKELPANASDYLIGGALNPTYYSTKGAFNGTGIALASQSFASNLSDSTHGSVVMYFQHAQGDIRWMELSTTGTWLGGSSSEVVATDARNGTPLSAVSFTENGSSTWHIFYIDHNDTLRQRSNSNSTNFWVDGPLNNLNLKAFDADQVGMQACWYGNDYGDSDYAHSPLPNSNSSSNSDADIGMHLWYASNATTFQQYGWRAKDNDAGWTYQSEWPNLNGHSGVGCYSWGPGSVTYVMFVNLDNTVEFWWKDTNTSITSTKAHPINVWTNTSIAVNNVQPSTSLGYTNFFYAQDAATNLFNGYDITWNAEKTTMNTANNFVVGGTPATPGIPGTHVSVSTIPQISGGSYITIFYQIEGDDITEYTRDLVAGQWTTVNLPIPQD